MQKAVRILLLLAATLAVTIASPRRTRMAEAEESAVAVQPQAEEVHAVAEDGAAEAAQPEVKEEEVADPEVQNDEPAETATEVTEVDAEPETEATPEETTAVDAVEPERVETADADAVADTVATTEAAQEDATEAAAEAEETNVLAKEPTVDETSAQKPKRHVSDIVSQIEAFFDLLSSQVAELVGMWQKDDDANH